MIRQEMAWPAGPEPLLAARRPADLPTARTNRQLERISKAKSDFVSVISHELRTPLTSIQGFSELIATEAINLDQARDFAATINQNALRLARMIGNALDLDRLAAGQIELSLEQGNLNLLVESVLASFRPTTAGSVFHVLLPTNGPA